MIDGTWTVDEIVEAYWDGRLEKFWPNLNQVISDIVASHLDDGYTGN